MKSHKLVILLLFASFATTLPILASASEQVLDTNGDPVMGCGDAILGGREYYILPAESSSEGGGLTLARPEGFYSRISVVQDNSEFSIGLPVRFTIKEDVGTSPIFTATTSLDIQFLHSSKWLLVEERDGSGTRWVGIYSDFLDERRRMWTVDDGLFRIERYGSRSGRRTYKLVLCFPPFMGHQHCFDIGRNDGDKYGRRIIDNTNKNEPYEVVFVKARSPNDARSIA